VNNVGSFQVPLEVPPLPDLAWLYGNQQPHYPFIYGKSAGLRSIKVTKVTQNAGLEKK
jgi:hypothetical protein